MCVQKRPTSAEGAAESDLARRPLNLVPCTPRTLFCAFCAFFTAISLPAFAHRVPPQCRNTVSLVPNRTGHGEQRKPGENAPGIGVAMTKTLPRRSRARLASFRAIDSQVFSTKSEPLSFLNAGDVRTLETRPEQ